MNKFVFLTSDPHMIGGNQMYVAGKSKWLEDRGCQVYLFFGGKNTGKSEIESLTKYIPTGAFKDLYFRPYRVSDRDRNGTLDDMIKALQLDSSDKVIIESHSDVLAYWGELLAERIHARHVYMCSPETYRDPDMFYLYNLDFFYFKLQRREIFGNDQAVTNLFNGHRGITKTTLDFPQNLVVLPEMDPVQNVTNPEVEKIDCNADFSICYIGRIEKWYIPTIFQNIVDFAHKYSNKTINVVIVGNFINEKPTELAHKYFSQLNNVSVYLTGTLSPIPRSLFKKLDVVIAGSQTAVFCAYENVPVIVAHSESDKVAGCLYYDTSDWLFAEPKFTYAEMLEKILILREYDNRVPNLPEKIPAEWHYEKYFHLLNQVEPKLEYFTTKFKRDLRRHAFIRFPFDTIKKGAKIVLYGENEVSLDYQQQIGKFCKLVAIVADDYEKFDKTVLPPEKLRDLEYDGIIIADFPNTDKINQIAENIIRITGKHNFIYNWQMMRNS